MSTLEKNSPIPLYYQLYSLLLKRITMGELKPGDMLPTEVALVKEYGVSRATVRQSILDLARNGYVVREKSKGTFVRNYNNVGYRDRVKGFTATLSEGEAVPLTSRVLDKRVLAPPGPVAQALGLRENEEAFYLKRIRYIRSVASTFVEDWIPYQRCPDIEKEHFTDASLYRLLAEKYKIVPHHAVRTFECSWATTEEQTEALEIGSDSPLLRCEGRVYDADDNPVEFYVALIKGKYTVRG